METPFYFNNQSRRLFGVLHEPNKKTGTTQNDCKIGIVFCHPFAEEKILSHRTIVNLSRKLTSSGFYCLRFDYMGHGDSEGNFEDATLDSRLSDITCAVKYFKNNCRLTNVGLLGVRFGATLAALSSMHSPAIDPLILIAPVVKGKPYLDQCLRTNLAMQMREHRKIIKNRESLIEDLNSGKVVNIDGYPLTLLFYDQVKTIDLMTKPLAAKNILILQISRRSQQDLKKEVKELYDRNAVNSKTVDAFNLKDHYFWMDNKVYQSRASQVEQATLSWLRNL